MSTYKTLLLIHIRSIDERANQMLQRRAAHVEEMKQAIRKEFADEIMSRPCGHEPPTRRMPSHEIAWMQTEARAMHEGWSIR